MTRVSQHRRCITALALVAMFVTALIETPAAEAQTYTVVHSFRGADGSEPIAGLIGDSAGNVYGTTYNGGASNAGVVFKLNKAGETVLYEFKGGADGFGPQAGLIRDSAGNLYGTTTYGGISSACAGDGCGVVFKLDTTGVETVLHSFTGGADGANPEAGLIRDSAGNLYGTTSLGGIGCAHGGCGVVFKLDTTGVETVLHNFRGADGDSPYAGLIRDSAGNLYGTTNAGGALSGCGGYGCGVVFKLDKTGETVLYSFSGGTDGAHPSAGLIPDSAGNLYGTTVFGGIVSSTAESGCGVVFKLDMTGTYTLLHSFTGAADGGNPGGLTRDSAGNLYGTTHAGGTGAGVVYMLDKGRYGDGALYLHCRSDRV